MRSDSEKLYSKIGIDWFYTGDQRSGKTGGRTEHNRPMGQLTSLKYTNRNDYLKSTNSKISDFKYLQKFYLIRFLLPIFFKYCQVFSQKVLNGDIF